MVLLVLVRLVFFVFKVQFLDYPFLFYFFFRSMENAQRQKEYREWKKLHDSNFLQKKLTRQKYYEPTNTLTKTQLKERREAVKQKVHDSVDQSRETATEINSNDIVKLNLQNRGASSREHRRPYFVRGFQSSSFLFKAPTPWPSLPLFLKFVSCPLFSVPPFLRYFRQFHHPHATPYCPNPTNQPSLV